MDRSYTFGAKRRVMRARSLASLFVVCCFIFALTQIAAGQTIGQRRSLNGVPVGRPEPWQNETDGDQIPPTRRDESALNGPRGNRRPVDGTAMLKRQKVNPQAANSSTIPYWSDSFAYQGLNFSYRMVGTDPKKGSTTTVIPTEIIPLRFVFADGSVFDASTDIIDGQTPIQGMVNSPVFQNHDFVLGGTDVGNTQYADAFQRANFWNSVSTRSPNYHVLLSQPTILPTQTIIVPADKGEVVTDPVTLHRYGVVDSYYLDAKLEALFDP